MVNKKLQIQLQRSTQIEDPFSPARLYLPWFSLFESGEQLERERKILHGRSHARGKYRECARVLKRALKWEIKAGVPSGLRIDVVE